MRREEKGKERKNREEEGGAIEKRLEEGGRKETELKQNEGEVTPFQFPVHTQRSSAVEQVPPF